MPSVAVKLYSVFFKFLLKHRLQNRVRAVEKRSDPALGSDPNQALHRRNSYGSSGTGNEETHLENQRRNSYGCITDDLSLKSENDAYRGYSPPIGNCRKLPLMVQFHGGGFVSGSNDSVANDFFCRRIAKLCDVIVLAAHLAECSKSLGNARGGGADLRKSDVNRHVADAFGASMVEPWLAAHGDPSRLIQVLESGFLEGISTAVISCAEVSYSFCDKFVSLHGGWSHVDCSSYACVSQRIVARIEPWPSNPMLCTLAPVLSFCQEAEALSYQTSDMIDFSRNRCVLLGVSCGANIADYVSRKAVKVGRLLDPVKVVAQVLMYPFFIGSIPTHSEIKLANSYFYDKAMCILAWKLFLPEAEFSLDHPAANPLVPGREPPLKLMPPTLTVVAEHDWMRDRAIAYSEELRKVNVDSPVLEYKDAVHEFATLDMLLKTPQAQACAEDIAIWVKKYISLRGHEFSY
ncbi:carboxyesterase 16 [Actinidia rufa]|uniref:Carboxyesterase 16 n=1 Tax=Actinidia rufa TaxID=165716 RepID=A0A7J0ELT5_9ERIC|nr:carboxyesterase 16 [Actinidia rufa]